MSVFNYLKSRLSILDVIGEYTHLKKAGTYWKGHCPFHSEKTASFTVSPHREIFYCFGCHMGGDVISFIEKVEHLSPMEAAHHLADRYGIDLPQEFASEPAAQEKKQYYDICKLVASWCHEHLKRSTVGLHYLLKRGFTKETIQQFEIGYFPGGYMAIKELISFAQKNNILAKDLIEANILQEGKTVLYSAFEERIIFPIKDHLGRHCGFGGRIFKPQDDRPKYYNSRENPYFKKGSLLFGFNQAKKAMQKNECAFLVEGYADCIAMAQYGYTNTVATLGTACTLEHLKNLSRYIKQLYVLYDGDKAGQEAMLRLTSLCWQASLELKVITLPAQEDPASFLTKGNSLAPFIDQAKDIFIFYIDSLGKDFATKPLSEKIAITKKLIQTIKTVEDSITQDILLQRVAKLLEISYESLKRELEKNNPETGSFPRTKSEQEKTESIDTKTAYQDHKLERNLFFAILSNIEIIKSDNVKLVLEYFPEPMAGILQKLLAIVTERGSIDFIQFFDSLNSYEKELVSKSLLEYDTGVDASVLDQLIVQIQRKNWKTIVQNVKKQLDRAKNEGNQAKEQQLLQQFMALKKKLLP